MGALMEFIFSVCLFLGLVALGFFAGSWTERRHYRSIRRREEELRHILVFAVRTPPEDFLPCRTEFVSGSVVVGMDYFKMIIAKLRNLVGGRVGSYETLIDRARREAVLRMKAEAAESNASCILNVKFSTGGVGCALQRRPNPEPDMQVSKHPALQNYHWLFRSAFVFS